MSTNTRTAVAALLLFICTAARVSIAPAADRQTAPNRDIPPEAVARLFGEEPTAPGPTPRAPDGHPDLSGYWKGSLATTPLGNIGKDLPGFKLPLTPAGAAALHRNLTATIDPESLCVIGGTPRHSASAIPFEIVQDSNRVAFLYYSDFRLVPVDGRTHDPDPDPSFYGDKIGRWEGDTFVIDTIGLKGSPESNIWIDENGNPQSDAMHAIERWTRPDANHLHLELTVEDSKFYTHPFKYARTWLLGKPREEWPEYSCSENNVDQNHLGPGPGPIKPDGTRGYLIPDLPKVPPPPEFYDTPPPK